MKKSNLKTLSCILTAAVIVSVINPVEIDAKKVIRLNKAKKVFSICFQTYPCNKKIPKNKSSTNAMKMKYDFY